MTGSSASTPSPVPPADRRPALRLGTRRSPLARTQSGWVADLLRARGHEVELVDVVTEGDLSPAPLTQIGGTGVFVSALRVALRQGRIDLAVHSLKDLPVAPEPELVLAAVPVREDPRDVLVAGPGMTFAQLPTGASIGTGSPRRAAQLQVARPDLRIVPIRGNVDSRLALVSSGQLAAIVLAAAGMSRLGRKDQVSEVLSTDIMLPAPGQGALAIECREDRREVRQSLAELADPVAMACTSAERAVLETLAAGCTAPVAALAVTDGVDQLHLTGFAGTSDGRSSVRRTLVGDGTDPVMIGRRLAEDLLAAGAHRFESRPWSGR